ncbi:amino acid adenylation domain-containing protein [Obesumbacterium proteus]|uniref:amino acid adenylation domain-containing protein n=1 Tax=Obesumbacterium proteus TaxID=82983 RepID=UPI00242ED011|nr:amino acid adenylation domain-containing protein [Obesumbacterium proteus]
MPANKSYAEKQPSLIGSLVNNAKNHPDKIAIIFEDKKLTYDETLKKIYKASSKIRKHTLGENKIIGVYCHPSDKMIISIWGTLFANCAYLPLSPDYPEERINYMVTQSRIETIITSKALENKVRDTIHGNINIICYEDIEQQNHVEEDTIISPSALAYIIYTSGSTGKPKGVMINHESIASQMSWLQDTFKFDANTVMLQKTPSSFDAAQWEILSLYFGATLVVGETGIYRDTEELINTIIKNNVTTLQCVPTLLQALLDSDCMEECVSLNQVFSGGEALTKTLASEFIKTMPKVQLINLYGPTECTINASYYTVTSDNIANVDRTIPIGYPVKNTLFYILDESKNPVPLGEIGELYIGGIQLAAGYLYNTKMTNEKFINHCINGVETRLYRTGDLVKKLSGGAIQFIGRSDNQVKYRGYRIELDEICNTIQTHEWVKHAAVLIQSDPRTKHEHLISCIELNPNQAALMDQGKSGAHHQTKSNKLQVKAQLSDLGFKTASELCGRMIIPLPNQNETEQQRKLAFSRKTYRFYDGGAVSKQDILGLLQPHEQECPSFSPQPLTIDNLGTILRNFGQFHSEERLLPKYSYASPGALYAVQIFLEIYNIDGISSGLYYFHPKEHCLYLIEELCNQKNTSTKVHFIGKKSAIECVYKNNIQEVLEFETGHILGLFDHVLSPYGLHINTGEFRASIKMLLTDNPDDYYLGSFNIDEGILKSASCPVDIYVQSHADKVEGLPEALYRYNGCDLIKVSNKIINKNHVIAINQQVYDNSSFGVALTSPNPEALLDYIALGRKLQQLQMNDNNFGFMSSGYSSKTGNNLPAANRLMSIISNISACYFALGGIISDEQKISTGMKEDSIHTKGPAEILRDDLYRLLPEYMVPKKIIVMDKLPQTANGKIDHKLLGTMLLSELHYLETPMISPRNEIETRIANIWLKIMKWDNVSVIDDFFESGGNSLLGVQLINSINKEFGCKLPQQILFESPTIEKLALKINSKKTVSASRFIRFTPEKDATPIFCWPGLGGYPMNLKNLAMQFGQERAFYGIQAYGLNEGECAFPTIEEMALADVNAIREIQPTGSYNLWGYSFGARVAFETAYQLEKLGCKVDNLYLIAPGSPKLKYETIDTDINKASYNNKNFVAILFSVFAHSLNSPLLETCLATVRNEEDFISFICTKYKGFDRIIAKKIVDMVSTTYEFEYSFKELEEHKVRAPITIFKAQGDNYSFIEGAKTYFTQLPTIIELATDHYSLLNTAGVQLIADLVLPEKQA